MVSLFLLQWIFLTQELKQGLLHCRQIPYQLSYIFSTPNNWIPTENLPKARQFKSGLSFDWILVKISLTPFGFFSFPLDTNLEECGIPSPLSLQISLEEREKQMLSISDRQQAYGLSQDPQLKTPHHLYFLLWYRKQTRILLISQSLLDARHRCPLLSDFQPTWEMGKPLFSAGNFSSQQLLLYLCTVSSLQFFVYPLFIERKTLTFDTH